MCASLYLHTCIYTCMQACVHKCWYTYAACAHVHTCVCTHVYTHVWTSVLHTFLYTCWSIHKHFLCSVLRQSPDRDSLTKNQKRHKHLWIWLEWAQSATMSTIVRLSSMLRFYTMNTTEGRCVHKHVHIHMCRHVWDLCVNMYTDVRGDTFIHVCIDVCTMPIRVKVRMCACLVRIHAHTHAHTICMCWQGKHRHLIKQDADAAVWGHWRWHQISFMARSGCVCVQTQGFACAFTCLPARFCWHSAFAQAWFLRQSWRS